MTFARFVDTPRIGARGIRHVLFVLAALALSPAHAEVWEPQYEPITGANGSRLGSSIAVRTVLDGGIVAVRVYVGAPNESNGALAEAGAVRIYNPGPNGWVLAATLRSSAPQAGAHFGATLAQGYAYLAVGAPDHNGGAGRVEFYRDNGQPSPSLVQTDAFTGSAGQHYGYALAMDGDKAAVGYTPSNDAGCLQTLHFNLATQHWQGLPAVHPFTCGTPGAKLGASLAIRRTGDANFLVVAGAPGESVNGQALAGVARAFVPNPDAVAGGLVAVGVLTAPDPTFLDVFGSSVGVSANHVYVGATGRDNGAGRVGSVLVFQPAPITGYSFVGEYFPGPPATIGGHCGASMAVDRANEQIVIGCPESAGSVANEGTARLLRKTTFLGQPVWLETTLTLAGLPHGADAFGSSLAVTGERVFVGARTTDEAPTGSDNGAWYEYGPERIFRDGFE
ncbi:MAG: FG-GAP repeat protein [Xanthomonadales bacterium]|nr:FG-GAP repeat protein [Xanthomonadales bacterium]